MLTYHDGSRYALPFYYALRSEPYPVILFPDNSNALYFANPLDLDVTRSILDHSISRLEESARALDVTRSIPDLEESARAIKSRRNELSPISRLPVDILRKIFSLIEDTGDSSIPYSDRRPESWTNFSQVSQHWRSSALSAPQLWTKIPLSYPRWAEEMLIRSKMDKLIIRSSRPLEMSNPKTIETIRSCFHEMNRVEEIDLTAREPYPLTKILPGNFSKSAPQLRTLCIRNHSSNPTFLFHQQFYNTERLQHVKLINCTINWETRLLTGLTRLTLENSIANSSIFQFFHALQRMPVLIELHLKHSIPDESKGLSTYPVVELPCLRVLHIWSSAKRLTVALRHITFPHSAMLKLFCGDEEFTQTSFSNFLSVLDTNFLSSLVIRKVTAIPKLTVGRKSGSRLYMNDNIEFYLWTTTINQDCFPSLISQSQLQLVLRWPSRWPQSFESAFTCAFNAMNLHFLTQLRLSTEEYIDNPYTWINTCGKLPLLEWVYVQSYATHSFLEAMVYKADQSKTAYFDVSFPKLRYIHLNGTEFMKKTISAIFEQIFLTEYVSSISVDMLMDCLMERYERNAEVQVLRLEDCYNISFNDVERLREIVVDVIWDGLEQRKPENDEKKKKERVFDSKGNNIEDLDYDDGDYICKGSCSLHDMRWNSLSDQGRHI